MAFHETSEKDPPDAPARGQRDARGREITFVRYFCVRWEDLAKSAIGYEALFNGLRNVMLPTQDGPPLHVPVPARAALMPAETRELAEVIAAGLLTTNRVCIVGGGEMR